MKKKIETEVEKEGNRRREANERKVEGEGMAEKGRKRKIGRASCRERVLMSV